MDIKAKNTLYLFQPEYNVYKKSWKAQYQRYNNAEAKIQRSKAEHREQGNEDKRNILAPREEQLEPVRGEGCLIMNFCQSAFQFPLRNFISIVDMLQLTGQIEKYLWHYIQHI